MENVSPIPHQGAVFFDPRDEGRFLRVSFHEEQNLFVLSWWRDSTCLGTFHLLPEEAPRLLHAIATGLTTAVPGAETGTVTGEGRASTA